MTYTAYTPLSRDAIEDYRKIWHSNNKYCSKISMLTPDTLRYMQEPDDSTIHAWLCEHMPEHYSSTDSIEAAKEKAERSFHWEAAANTIKTTTLTVIIDHAFEAYIHALHYAAHAENNRREYGPLITKVAQEQYPPMDAQEQAATIKTVSKIEELCVNEAINSISRSVYAQLQAITISPMEMYDRGYQHSRYNDPARIVLGRVIQRALFATKDITGLKLQASDTFLEAELQALHKTLSKTAPHMKHIIEPGDLALYEQFLGENLNSPMQDFNPQS